MYYETIQQFAKILRNLHGILGKAQKHAEAKKFDPNNFVTARLAPDMFAFTRQIQSASDGAKLAAARLTGAEVPRFEDTEKTLAELSERLEKTFTLLDGFRPEQFDGAAGRHITFPWAEGKYLLGHDYLVQFAVPNFYFHVAMAYALLRQAGVDIGKIDFLGAMPFHSR